jgi:hypothetical protein
MSLHADLLDKVQAILEGLTPLSDQRYRFQRLEALNPEQADDAPEAHRMFSLSWTGERTILPWTGQFVQAVFRRVLAITIIYRVERDQREIESILAEDGDQIAWALMNPANRADLSASTPTGQHVQFDPQASETINYDGAGGSLTVTHTVAALYRITRY